MFDLQIPETQFRSLVKSVVARVFSELEQLKKTHDGRLAYTEAEAASMLGLKQHQLRDIRLDGKISHTRIVGRQIRYTPQDLIDYLTRERVEVQQ
jgi:hypothetical protein